MLNIILVSRHLRAPMTLSLERRPQALALAGALLLLVVALLAAGWGLGRWVGSDTDAAAQRLEAARAELDTLRRTVQRDVNAVAVRVAELQAQANRLNALGGRLADQGQLAAGEFDFESLPDVGGPEDRHDLAATLDSVEQQFTAAEQQLDVLAALLQDQQADAARVPSRMPAPGYVSSGFGVRADPFTGGRSHHLGIDIDANTGDPIKAAADGVVSFAGVKPGYGHTVIVDHGNGYQTLYAHNQKNLVRPGDVVRAGHVLGTVGSSGRSTGSHLHFEVHVNGRPVNPTAYLNRVRGRG
jgi:murein DD-endopeptidase MepM/ murein hydrolase activator NlpD